MKSSILLVVLLLICFSSFVAQSPAETLQLEHKVKVKNHKTIVRDKSKPVRRALENWYVRNMEAFNSKDVTAVMALRTDDFSTLTPDGKVNTRADMEKRTVRFLDMIDQFISQDYQIGTIEVNGDLASADITQRTVRRQRLPDGTIHKVEAAVLQRETWKKTTEGWKLYRVDNIRDIGVWVDDKPYKP